MTELVRHLKGEVQQACMIHFLNNILVIVDHFIRKSIAKIFIGLLRFYAITKKETLIQLLAENNGKMNMN